MSNNRPLERVGCLTGAPAGGGLTVVLDASQVRQLVVAARGEQARAGAGMLISIIRCIH